MGFAKSLRSRLVLAAAVWVALGCVASFVALSLIFREQTRLELENEVRIHVEELFRLTKIADDGTLSLSSRFSDPRYDDEMSGYYWQARLGSSPPLRSASLADKEIDWPVHRHGAEQPVVLHMAAGPTGPMIFAEKAMGLGTSGDPIFQLLVATDTRHFNTAVAAFDARARLALFLFAVSMIVSAAILVVFALSPLKRLQHSLQEVKLGRRPFLEHEFPSEVRPVVLELNELISSMGTMLQRARTQAGNLAHGLKGPLSIITDEAYELIDGRYTAESSAAILEQSLLMQRHIDHHVARARAVAGIKMPGLNASIPLVIDQVAEAVSRLYPDRVIDTSGASDVELAVAVDVRDMFEVLGNLLDNACKYGARIVRVTAQRAGNEFIEVLVDDDGPGLPPEAWKEVLAIGIRWDERKPGTGLGLAIVDELVSLYGGSIKLGRSQMGGLNVRVMLPATLQSVAKAT